MSDRKIQINLALTEKGKRFITRYEKGEFIDLGYDRWKLLKAIAGRVYDIAWDLYEIQGIDEIHYSFLYWYKKDFPNDDCPPTKEEFADAFAHGMFGIMRTEVTPIMNVNTGDRPDRLNKLDHGTYVLST